MRTLVFCAVLGALATDPAWAEGLPELRSRAAVVLDATTGDAIFSKAADEIRPIASTTKIFVAMAVRKRLDLNGWTEITKVDARYAAGGARTRLDIGQIFRNKDLLRAMLIASDNRAPTALARAAGMAPDELVAAMNAVARDLHLVRTKLTDPTGLRGNLSTAHEMALALRAALDDDVLRSIMRQDEADIESRDHYTRIHYGSTNAPLVAKQWDVIGGKTGYTKQAGYCFITGVQVDDRTLVMALLGADDKMSRFGDFNRLAQWIDRGAPGAHKADPRRKETPIPSAQRTAIDPPDAGPRLAGKRP